MAHRARLVLLLTLILSPSGWLFSQDTATKLPQQASKTHCEIPSCVQKILYFSNIAQPTDLQDVVNALRVITDLQRVQQLMGPQIIAIEGTPEQIAIAEKLAAEIDKAKRRFGGLGYRLDFKLHESEGDKRLQTRAYSFISEAHQSAKISIERAVPAPVHNDSSSETKQASESTNARSIECRILAENEHTLELSVETAFASETTAGGPPSPLLRSRLHLTVELDKPTMISRIDDPDSNRSFTIELTATRIKDRS